MLDKNPPAGQEDHGLGIEVVDPSTAIKEAHVVEADRRRLERHQQSGTTYWVIATAALILLGEQTVLSLVLFTPVLAQVAAEFRTADVVWMLTAFTLAAAVLSPLMTKLGDVFGKRKILLVGAGIAAVGCLVCVVAPTFLWLLVGRVLMATAAAFLPLTVALMREVFPTRMRAVAIGLATNGFGLIVVGGPVLAGLLTDTWGIRAVFVFNLAICVVAPLLVWLLVPESPLRTRSRIDYLGALFLGVGVFGLLIGLTQLSKLGLGLVTGGCIVLGVAGLVFWWMRQARIPEPLISLKLLSRKTVLLPVLAFLAYTGVSGTMNVLAALHWSASPERTDYGFGLSSLHIGWWSAPAGVLSVLAGLFVGLTARSIGYRNHMIIAGIFWIVPAILLGLNLHAPPAFIIVVYGLFGVANMYSAAAMCLLLLAAPEDQRGVVLGMKGAITGIAGAAIQQTIFLILSASTVSVEAGVPVYSSGGFTIAYIVAGLIGVIGIVAAVLIPQGRRVKRSERVAPTADTTTTAPAEESADRIGSPDDGEPDKTVASRTGTS